MYSRPEFIKIVGSKYSELRFYERRGLLVPDEINEQTGRRYYSENAVAVFRYIQALQQVGYSLNAIQAHLEQRDGLTDTEFYAAREAALRAQLSLLDEIKRGAPVTTQKAKKRYKRPVAKKQKGI